MKNITLMFAYITIIAAANVVTASIAPLSIGTFIVPMGTFFIGVTFILRDLVQNAIGRRATYGVITAALVVSAITSYVLGDTLWITAASAITFALSETCDTEIYTRLKTSFITRVLVSGLVGGTIDSAVFVIIGLSPLGAGFLPWAAVPMAILGQVIVKGVLQVVGVAVIKLGGQSDDEE